jgi:hypothetical protein
MAKCPSSMTHDIGDVQGEFIYMIKMDVKA